MGDKYLRHLAANRPTPRRLHAPGVLKLSANLRLRFNMSRSCSRNRREGAASCARKPVLAAALAAIERCRA
jgi:hypothetical protein